MFSSGFINVNKPEGLSSAAVVSKIKRLTGLACGHMGTLDPMASGVLPVAVGNATRLFDYLLNKEKVYRAVFLFGADSATLDATAKEISEGYYVPSQEEISSVLRSFVGEIDQMPPQFSAKSVNGVRAYKLARQGKEVFLNTKKVKIYSIDLLGQEGKDSYTLRIACGGGTYIRSLARDIAKACGTKAIMTSLVREKSGCFCLKDSVKLSELNTENWQDYLVSADEVFDFPIIVVGQDESRKLRNGLSVSYDESDGEFKLYFEDGFYGIGEVASGKLRAKVKLV